MRAAIAMNVAAHTWLADRFELKPPVERWESARLPGVELGRQLHASGELHRLALDSNATIEHVLKAVVRSDHLEKAPPLHPSL